MQRRLLPLLATPLLLHATGFEEPARWLDQAEKPVLSAPEFYFELEVKRLAAELNPGVKALIPPLKDEARDYDAQTDEADAADYADALKTGAIKPPDAEKEKAAHEAAREMTIEVAEFPSEFADYDRGAFAFHHDKLDDASAAWKALLARPAAERHYRTMWAAFMLGRLALKQEKWEDAQHWFAETRKAAREGFRDSLGLAAAAFGWDAYANLHAGRYADAAKLYLYQLATGDISAVVSLRVVLDEVFEKNVDLAEVVRDPVLQRVATACAVAQMGPFSGEAFFDAGKDDRGSQWLKALEAADAKNVRDADRVAWLAYSKGDYHKAARWLKRAGQDEPYALWLRAKFALRAGKVEVATQLLAQAVEKLPPTPNLDSRSPSPSELPPDDAVKGDLGALRLSRGEFLAALKLFLAGGQFPDAVYLAEGVLTIDELTAFVQREYPAKPKPDPAAEKPETDTAAEPSNFQNWHSRDGDPGDTLRQILARRLVRAGRFAAARPYFEAEKQAVIDEYASLLEQGGKRGASNAEKAAALWKAAQLIVDHAGDFVDFDDPLTIAQRLSGQQVETGEYPVIALKYGKPDTFVPPISGGERERLKKNVAAPVHRRQGLYVAADLGWRAAALMPDNDEQTARVLNTAGSWLKYRDDGAADRFYQAIERRCAQTALGKEAIKRHWFVDEPEPAP